MSRRRNPYVCAQCGRYVPVGETVCPLCDEPVVQARQPEPVGIRIPLDFSVFEIGGVNRILDALEQSDNTAVARIVTTGRQRDALVLPNLESATLVHAVVRSFVTTRGTDSKTWRPALDLIKKIEAVTGLDPNQGLLPRQTQESFLGPSCTPGEGTVEVTRDEINRARRLVGVPTVKVRPLPSDPLFVSYGLGVDSTAVLVGLARLYREGRHEFRPSVILFADTGSEKPETYAYLERMNRWLSSVGFPSVQIVGWVTEHTAKGYGTARTLEQQCLINQTMPSISASKFGQSLCSVLWKQDTMNRWVELESGLLDRVRGRGWVTRHGGKIVKAIGYDASETKRATKGTFRVDQELRSLKEKGREPIYEYWYPLQAWNWDRARCIAEIESEPGLGTSPPKSSCTMCGAMTKDEIAELPKDLLMRALLIEAVANRGRHAAVQSWGLGVREGPTRPNYWIDFAKERGLVNAADLRELERQVQVVLAAAPEAKGTGYVGAHENMAHLPAFSDVLGFRGRRLPIWDRFEVLEGGDE